MEWNYDHANENNTASVHMPRDVDAPSWLEMRATVAFHRKPKRRTPLLGREFPKMSRAVCTPYLYFSCAVNCSGMLYRIAIATLKRASFSSRPALNCEALSYGLSSASEKLNCRSRWSREKPAFLRGDELKRAANNWLICLINLVNLSVKSFNLRVSLRPISDEFLAVIFLRKRIVRFLRFSQTRG